MTKKEFKEFSLVDFSTINKLEKAIEVHFANVDYWAIRQTIIKNLLTCEDIAEIINEIGKEFIIKETLYSFLAFICSTKDHGYSNNKIARMFEISALKKEAV